MNRAADQTAKAAARLRTALDLQRTGIAMMKQSLRRRFPDDNEQEIGQRLTSWLRDRKGAELGDGVGRPVAWPRIVQCS
jgi:hypothetical protein